MARPSRPTIVGGPTVGTVDGNADVASSDSGIGDSGDVITIDPTDVPDSSGSVGDSSGDSGSVAGSPQPKRRGRKPGSGNRAKSAALDINGLANIIAGFHTLLAAVTRAEELALDDEEAKRLAQASALVARHYNVEVAAKTTDWINLGIVAGGIYAPRIMAIRMRVSEDRRERRARPTVDRSPPQQAATTVVSEAPEMTVDAFGFPISEFPN